jgi:hypothetical protein
MAQATSQYQLVIGGGGMATMVTQSTAVQLTATATPCQMVQLRAISTNTAAIWVGNSTVKCATTARIGVPVFAGSTAKTVEYSCKDLSGVYIDGISTEALSYVYYVISVP